MHDVGNFEVVQNYAFPDTRATLLLLQSLVLWFSQGLTLRINAGIN